MLFKVGTSALPDHLEELLAFAQLLYDIDLFFRLVILDDLDDVRVLESLQQLYLVIDASNL